MKSFFLKKHIFVFLFILTTSFTSCKPENTLPTDYQTDSFAKGADVSWITEMEKSGKKFYTPDGKETECMELLKGLGMNTIRLRVWVDPAEGWNGKEDVLAKAKRAKALGMRLMIAFHYSDTWADPANQKKPEAWTTLNFTDLKTALSDHTIEMLTLLKDNGISPEWVQVGNEINDGMLWEDGRATKSISNLASFISAGYDAVKSVFPQTKVIVHLSSGEDNAKYRWFFDALKENGGKWDVIGMSVYPYWYSPSNDWRSCNIAVSVNMNDMVIRYGKEVMIVECGMAWDNVPESKAFLTDLVAKAKSIPNGRCLGVLYWEPQAYADWKNYKLGAFDNLGKPTDALNAFQN